MLKAGFARMDITPSLGVSLKGYYRERICDGILDPLEINAVAFEEDGKKAVLLTADIPLAKPMKNSGLSYGQSALLPTIIKVCRKNWRRRSASKRSIEKPAIESWRPPLPIRFIPSPAPLWQRPAASWS